MKKEECLLFSTYDLRSVIGEQNKKIIEEINGFDKNYILNTSIEDLRDYLESKHHINPLVLQKDKIYIKSNGDVDIDVSRDPIRDIRDRSKPFYVKGSFFEYAIPFEGDKGLFLCGLSAYILSPPRAYINDKEIIIIYKELNPDINRIKANFERHVFEIESYLVKMLEVIEEFNKELRQRAKQQIETLKAKILKDKNIVESLGYPIKQISNMPTTFAIPVIKRKIVIQKPKGTTTPFVSEPVLDLENYEAILKIISSMVLVMERSPSAFSNMKEENLRQHFLVQLNGHFEGEATGETFNFNGKTDILIRSNEKNIFIAECMFWNGERSLLEKINQFLGYISWRDTKTALLVFNKSKKFTDILLKIPEIVKKHMNFKRQEKYNSETGFRFILHHNGDANRELILTIIAFNIPVK